MSRNYVLQYKNCQKNFFISEELSKETFCKLIKSVFQIKQSISALQDINGNVYDIVYFCENFHTLPDRFFFVLSSKPKSRARKHRKNQSSLASNSSQQMVSPFYIPDFQNFLVGMELNAGWVIVLIFDSLSHALDFGQLFVECFQSQFPIANSYFTVFKDDDSNDDVDSVLLSVFQNQNLVSETEIELNETTLDDLIHFLDGIFQGEDSLDRRNDIPIIVTHSQDHSQVLNVPHDDNAITRSRPRALAQLKQTIEKLRHQLDPAEYDVLQEMLMEEDQHLLNALQIPDEAQFLNRIKQLALHRLPEISFHVSNLKIQNPNEILQKIMETNILKGQELGMLKEERNRNSELEEIVRSVMESDMETIASIVKTYLKDKFISVLKAEFSPSQIDYFYEQNQVRFSPVNAAWQNFENLGNLKEFLEVLRENAVAVESEDDASGDGDEEDGNQEQESSEQEYEFPPKADGYSHILRSRGGQRKNTFKFTIQVGEGENSVQQAEEHYKDKRRKSDEENTLEQFKEQQFLDKFHLKTITDTHKDYEKLLLMILDQKEYFDEQEKTKLIHYYQQANQKLLQILDRFSESQNLNAVRSELLDLTILVNSKRFDEIQSPTRNHLIAPKLQKLKNFKFLISFFYEIDKVFTIKQMKTFIYLYLIEDMNILSAYEVYCETRDQVEFVQTLTQIFKIYSLTNHLNLDFEEIEQFDELINQQLNILFAYRRNFSLEERSALEKVRACFNVYARTYERGIPRQESSLWISQGVIMKNNLQSK